MEHPVHVGDLGHVPLGQVQVEGSRTPEHPSHIGDMGHVPLANWSVTFGARTRCGSSNAYDDSMIELAFGFRGKYCVGGDASPGGSYGSVRRRHWR